MNKAVFTLLLSGTVIALSACGQGTPTSELSNTPVPTASSATEADYKAAAQLLIDNGFTKADARAVQEMVNTFADRGTIKQLSLDEQRQAKATTARLNTISDLILSDEVEKNLTPQWRVDNATLAYRIQGIALSSMADFNNTKSKRGYDTFVAALNWDNNGCSIPFGYTGPMAFVSNKFLDACVQHDFGYRNGAIYKQTHSLAHKMAVDTHFLNNMRIICDRTPSTAWNCREDATIVYHGVSNVAVEFWWLANTPPQRPGQY